MKKAIYSLVKTFGGSVTEYMTATHPHSVREISVKIAINNKEVCFRRKYISGITSSVFNDLSIKLKEAQK